jgi:hypothetical protein
MGFFLFVILIVPLHSFMTTSVACAVAQVLPCPQLIFPSKTWFFGKLFEFSVAKIT